VSRSDGRISLDARAPAEPTPPKGAERFATLRTIIHTARKQGWNVLDTLAHPEPTQLIPQLRH